MDKLKAKRAIVAALILILAVSLILVSFHAVKAFSTNSDQQAVSIAISFAEALGLIVSLVVAVSQLTDSKEIAKATFIMEINRAFVENSQYMELYDAFQACFDQNCPHSRGCAGRCQLCLPKSYVSNYLTFFETIYLLLQNGVISFDLIDDLFSYRFFLAVHHPYVQQVKLRAQPQNFRNIFILEKWWLDYKRAHGRSTDGIYAQNRLKFMTLPAGVTYEALTG